MPVPLAILGCGRAGSALALRAAAAGWPVAAVWNRTPARAQDLAARVGAWVAPTPAAAAREADLVAVAVADRAIAPVAAAVAAAGAWRRGHAVLHLSGALDLAPLAPARAAGAAACACHPLLAIADPATADFAGARFLLEGDPDACRLAASLVRDLGGIPLQVPLRPGGRPLYHAAAAVASNLTVALTALAVELLEQAGLSRQEALAGLLPLLRSTLANLERAGLPRALTGPVARGDAETVASHLRALTAHPEALGVYRSLGAVALRLAREAGLSPERAEAVARLLAGAGDGSGAGGGSGGGRRDPGCPSG